MPRKRSAAVERELLRQWNNSIPIDGREREPPVEQLDFDDLDDGSDEPDEWEEPGFGEDECGWMGPRLGCSMAGSEECDFECPVRAEQLRRRRRKKKGAG